MILNFDYIKTPTGIAKGIALGCCAATSVLAATYTRPTELQKEIVESTWKEDGLLYNSLAGLALSLISIGICALIKGFCKNFIFRKFDLFLYFVVGINFLLFGSGTLESALSIYVRIADCCKDYNYESSPATCNLPAFIMEGYYDFVVLKVPSDNENVRNFFFRPGMGDHEGLKACEKDIEFNSVRCALCLNHLIQPRYDWKGASAALGIITGIFFLIVDFVTIREARTKEFKAFPY